MRTILTGRTLNPECDNPIEFGKSIRLLGVKEVYYIIAKASPERLLALQTDTVEVAKTSNATDYSAIRERGRGYSMNFGSIDLDGAIFAIISNFYASGVPLTSHVVADLVREQWEGIGLPVFLER
jgi:hypothetical protein